MPTAHLVSGVPVQRWPWPATSRGRSAQRARLWHRTRRCALRRGAGRSHIWHVRSCRSRMTHQNCHVTPLPPFCDLPATPPPATHTTPMVLDVEFSRVCARKGCLGVAWRTRHGANALTNRSGATGTAVWETSCGLPLPQGFGAERKLDRNVST